MNEIVFDVGQTVVATGSYQHSITEGKQYKVVRYQAEFYNPTFTWPAYVTVIGDFGKAVTSHTYRYRALREGEVDTLAE